jgi:hypothetical protein
MLVCLLTSFFAIRFRAFLWVRWIVLVLCNDMFHIVILWFRTLLRCFVLPLRIVCFCLLGLGLGFMSPQLL